MEKMLTVLWISVMLFVAGCVLSVARNKMSTVGMIINIFIMISIALPIHFYLSDYGKELKEKNDTYGGLLKIDKAVIVNMERGGSFILEYKLFLKNVMLSDTTTYIYSLPESKFLEYSINDTVIVKEFLKNIDK